MNSASCLCTLSWYTCRRQSPIDWYDWCLAIKCVSSPHRPAAGVSLLLPTESLPPLTSCPARDLQWQSSVQSKLNQLELAEKLLHTCGVSWVADVDSSGTAASPSSLERSVQLLHLHSPASVLHQLVGHWRYPRHIQQHGKSVWDGCGGQHTCLCLPVPTR